MSLHDEKGACQMNSLVRNNFVLSAVLLVLLAASARAAPPACTPDAGDCCVESRLPGCNVERCCAEVCACDPFCCDVVWDQACATFGQNLNGCGAAVLCEVCMDSDGDGVTDGSDVCCDTPGDVIVDEHGRPLGDLDRDCDVDLDDFKLFQRNLHGVREAARACCVQTPLVCADGDLCTIDSCQPNQGCVNQEIVCDPGGECDPHTGLCGLPGCETHADCDDEDLCTTDTCTDGVCGNVAVDCDDADACTNESCDAATGECVHETFCDDDNPCTTDTCTDGVCDYEEIWCPQGEACNPATGRCEEFSCTSDADCDDGIACTTNSCNAATGDCIFFNVDARCNDGLFCSGTSTCDPSDADADADGCLNTGNPCANPTPVCNEATDACEGCWSNADCNDGIACTNDTCDGGSGFCTHVPDDNLCPDPGLCNGVDFCDPWSDYADSSGCVPTWVNPCAPWACDEAGDYCFACASNADCDDGIACTDDFCDGISGFCTNNDNCGILTCNLNSGECE